MPTATDWNELHRLMVSPAALPIRCDRGHPGGRIREFLRLLLPACLLAMLVVGIGLGWPGPLLAAPALVDLQQGWRPEEVDLYAHRSEGTNLAPLELALALPDPRRPGHRFLEDLADRYGFIAAERSGSNPHALPVGLAVDARPERYGDRSYLGLTCAACHTRELRARPAGSVWPRAQVRLAVHGGPGLVDIAAFSKDFYDAFDALRHDDKSMARFAADVLQHPATIAEIESLKGEISDFLEPVLLSRELIKANNITASSGGPGNLNALSQGYYNNIALQRWLASRQLLAATPDSRPAPLLPVGLAGAVSFPPVWFSPDDDWAQWFAEIDHPGLRNWLQAVSTSPVRPPQLAAELRQASLLATIDFDGIDAIQDGLDRLRTPLWPQQIFGRLQPARLEAGEHVFQQHCASCHVTRLQPANGLGRRFWERRAFAVGTDPVAYEQFEAQAEARVQGLKQLATGLLQARHQQLLRHFSNDATLVANTELQDSKGRPDDFALARDYNGASGAAYWAVPLEGVFATSPYLHNGSVRTLADLLTPPEQRPRQFHTGTNQFDPRQVGLRDAGAFLYDTTELGKSAQGHDYGTTLRPDQKRDLIDYLKSL